MESANNMIDEVMNFDSELKQRALYYTHNEADADDLESGCTAGCFFIGFSHCGTFFPDTLCYIVQKREERVRV